MTIMCLVLGGHVKRVRDEKTATEKVRSWGGTAILDYQFEPKSDLSQLEMWPSATAVRRSAIRSAPPQPRFQRLRKLMGDHYFSSVVAVPIPYHATADVNVDVLDAFRSLRSLSLNGTHANDDDVRKLTRLNEIEVLRLSDTDVTDDGIQWLVRLPKLRILSLRGTVISDAGLLKLCRHNSLQYVDVSDTYVTEVGRHQLQTALPGCTVIAGAPEIRQPMRW
jgi:hypothetical protein